jgi:DNA-binding MarR family transcriptional regulator
MTQLTDEIRASQRATDVVDELSAQLLGVNRTDSRCLDILEQRAPMSAGDLARASNLTTGAITAVIDRLERAGLARRIPDATDRRRVLIELTDTARRAIEAMFGPMAELARPMVTRYSDDDLKFLIEFNQLMRGVQERLAEMLRERLRDGRGPGGG